MNDESLKSFFTALDESLKVAQEQTAEAKAGVVKSVKDGIIQIEGISELRMGEVVRIKQAEVDALVVQIGRDETLAVTLNRSIEVRVGQPVESTGRILGLPVSEKIIGRVVDPLGRPLDDKGKLSDGTVMPLETVAPSVIDRESVSQPVQTGIVAIDALIPIGRGQRELIIGDRQTGKTTIAIDTILNQKGQDMICIYVAVAQRDSKTTQVIKTLTEHGALDYTVVVAASASEPAMMHFLAPYAGSAIAEYFMKQGKDVLVIYDDLSKHAVAYREVSLLLRKPPGREAYPGDVFYIHSRLLERAAKLDSKHGGGSITALPIIETQAGDVSAYIPTNVISITDGQIFLEPSLFYRGIRPALNVGISVSRVGGDAQTKIMKKIAGTAKLDLAQYYDLAAFAQFASELDSESKQKLIRGERLQETLKQKAGSPRSLWQEVVMLWAATKGYLDDIELKDVTTKLEHLLTTFESAHKDVVKEIEKEKTLTDTLADKLDASIKQVLKAK